MAIQQFYTPKNFYTPQNKFLAMPVSVPTSCGHIVEFNRVWCDITLLECVRESLVAINCSEKRVH